MIVCLFLDAIHVSISFRVRSKSLKEKKKQILMNGLYALAATIIVCFRPVSVVNLYYVCVYECVRVRATKVNFVISRVVHLRARIIIHIIISSIHTTYLVHTYIRTYILMTAGFSLYHEFSCTVTLMLNAKKKMRRCRLHYISPFVPNTMPLHIIF